MTSRPRVPARSPGTTPTASARCWSAARAARPATSSTRRWTGPRSATTCHQVRMDELARATSIIGYDEVVLLGYRDSGMPGTPENDDPRSFAQAPLDEAVGRLVAVIRRTRPQVIVDLSRTSRRATPIPDHLRVHEISVPAFEAAGDPDAFPEAGPPWQPLKLYYTDLVAPAHRRHAREVPGAGHGVALRREVVRDARSRDERTTTRIDVSGFTAAARPGPAGARHPGRPDVEVLVRAARPRWPRRCAPSRSTCWPAAGSTSPSPEDDVFGGIPDLVSR